MMTNELKDKELREKYGEPEVEFTTKGICFWEDGC